LVSCVFGPLALEQTSKAAALPTLNIFERAL
jgi:hypothetical protein